MDQDIDFDKESSRSARKNSSRRRKDLDDDDNLDSVLDSALVSTSASSKPQPQPRKKDRNNDSSRDNKDSNAIKAVSGWGEDDDDLNTFNDAPTEKKPHRREPGQGVSMDFGSDQKPAPVNQRQFNQRELNDQEEIEIPEIPDLEEQEEPVEDMAFKIAEAPDVQVHQISTYKELDKEFFKEKAFQFLEGNIDVSLLHCGLNTEQQIAEEEDVIWEWNKLFTEVVSILSTNRDADRVNVEVDPFGDVEELNKLATKTKVGVDGQGKRHRDRLIMF